MAQARDWRGRFASGSGLGGAPSRTVKVRGGSASVTKLKKGGGAVKPGRIATNVAAGRPTSLLTRRARVGSPISGNKNVRYVSRTNAVARGGLTTGAIPRAAGRAVSRRGASRSTAPKGGYVVSYNTRTPKG